MTQTFNVRISNEMLLVVIYKKNQFIKNIGYHIKRETIVSVHGRQHGTCFINQEVINFSLSSAALRLAVRIARLP
jgi:hypothetical protein